MARGNQREKAREKNLKQQAAQMPMRDFVGPRRNVYLFLGNTGMAIVGDRRVPPKTGSEMQREKEALAELMRKKQEAANAKKAVTGDGAAKKK
ncbi:four F5 protein [Poronia punctata]|nr:four F5 protein [Poronia punctata]